MTNDCLFCKIAAKDIPADVLAETDSTFAFRDINPQAPTHVLVIPKFHIPSAAEVLPEHGDVLAAMFATAQQVAKTEDISPDAGAKGYRLVLNVGEDAQNTVPHLHMHVLGGRGLTWPPG